MMPSQARCSELMWASERGWFDTVKHLLYNGAKLELRDLVIWEELDSFVSSIGSTPLIDYSHFDNLCA